MEYYCCDYYEDADMGAWARDVLSRPPPLPGSSHHRELMSAIKSTIRTLVQHQATLAPIRRLPREILGHIFRLTLGGYTRENLRHYWRQLVKITAVCRTWRAAALDAPQLWAWYTIRGRPSDDFLLASQCWLARSGNVSLDVEIDIQRTDSSFILKYLSSAVKQRMKTVLININSSPLIHVDPLLQVLSEAPQLRTLQLSYGRMAQPHRLSFLQKLRLEGTSGILRLECSSLVYLRLSCRTYSFDELKFVANAAPMLQSIYISDCRRTNGQSHDGNERHIFLPSLKKLVIIDSDPLLLLDFIHSENLQQLLVDEMELSTPFPPLKRLLKLEIYAIRCDEAQDAAVHVVDWLEQAREVKELLISTYCQDDPDEAMTCILAHMAVNNLCPLLRAIKLQGCSTDILNIISQFENRRPECKLSIIESEI